MYIKSLINNKSIQIKNKKAYIKLLIFKNY